MDPSLQAFVTGLPAFLVQGGIAILIWAFGVWLYMAITPHREIELVRAGNSAAGLSLGGASIGIAIPIAATLATSHALLDVIIWGVTALILQLVMFRLVDLVVRDLSKRIENGEMAAAAVLVGVKIGAALLTASALNG